ncbi:hypothetical protein AB0C81_12005 [Streptomyces roseoverticillatus]|uniref:hypothetical protein n=1 Tax=Streptomyces roseoverticillatus TaxID=66429 RepID=UPI0033C10659
MDLTPAAGHRRGHGAIAEAAMQIDTAQLHLHPAAADIGEAAARCGGLDAPMTRPMTRRSAPGPAPTAPIRARWAHGEHGEGLLTCHRCPDAHHPAVHLRIS